MGKGGVTTKNGLVDVNFVASSRVLEFFLTEVLEKYLEAFGLC